MKTWTSTTGRTDVHVAARTWSVDITATTIIAATAERVWSVLTDTDRYPEWNPFVRRLSGRLAVGHRLDVILQPADKPQTMHPRVVDAVDGQSFAWRGRVLVPGILDGTHRFTVEPVDHWTARLVQSERLSGALVPLFRSMLTQDAPRAFAAMNDALALQVHASRQDTPAE